LRGTVGSSDCDVALDRISTACRGFVAPEDAFRCFMGSEIELLVADNCILRKEKQDPRLKLDYKDAFDLD
jgi:hypothetical protein